MHYFGVNILKFTGPQDLANFWDSPILTPHSHGKPQHLTPQDRSPKQWLRGRLAYLTPDDDRKSVLKAINEEIDKIPKSNEWTEQDTAG
jgi:hypothetical protein